MHLLPPCGATAKATVGAWIDRIAGGKGRPLPIVPVFIRHKPAQRTLARSFQRFISYGHSQSRAEFNGRPQPLDPCEGLSSASRQSPVAGRISDHCDKRPAERSTDGGAVLQLRCDLAVLQQRAEEISGLCEFVPTDRRYAAERR